MAINKGAIPNENQILYFMYSKEKISYPCYEELEEGETVGDYFYLDEENEYHVNTVKYYSDLLMLITLSGLSTEDIIEIANEVGDEEIIGTLNPN